MADKATYQVFKPLLEDSFTFKCHKEIRCFTSCCAALRLQLTPYDILRLKNRIGLSSGEFLDTFGEIFFEEWSRFPLIRLKMREVPSGSCPFVSSSGCSLYEDRPGSCRIYPLGRAAIKNWGGAATKEKYFLVQEQHCLGFEEDHKWSVEEWMKNEGMDEYNTMNDLWIEVVTLPKSLGLEKDLQRKIQMFFMASYNLDRFRSFVLDGPFQRRFSIDNQLLKKMAADDVYLLRFSFEWLKFSLFGVQSQNIRVSDP